MVLEVSILKCTVVNNVNVKWKLSHVNSDKSVVTYSVKMLRLVVA